MDFPSLRALVGAIKRIEPNRRIVLFGSSSLLASFPNLPPASIGVEVTLDADVFLDPDSAEARAALKREMGQGGAYHIENGFYCDFIDARADQWFPPGWKHRLISFPECDGVFAIQPLDAASAKLVATAQSRVDKRLGRRPHDRGTKDIDTVVALIRSGMLGLGDIIERSRLIDMEPAYLAELAKVEAEVASKTES
ncbi:MAG: hypothetical protein ABL962_09655 [Fimbriimonadaceae bacterium]